MNTPTLINQFEELKRKLATETRHTNRYMRLFHAEEEKTSKLENAIKEIAEYAPYLPDRDIRVVLALCRKALS